MNRYYKYFFFYCIPALILIIICSNFIFPNPSFKNNDDLAYFAENKQNKIGACQSYISLLQKDSTNSKYILKLAKEWYSSDERERTLFELELSKKGLNPNQQYNTFIKSNSPKIKNAGYFGKACMHFYSGYGFGANKTLDSISNNNYLGYNYLKGLIAESNHQYNLALKYFFNERENIILKSEAELKIIYLLYSFGDYEPLKIIIKSENIKKKLSPTIERRIYLLNNDYTSYIAVLHQHIFRKIDNAGFFAAFIIMLIWLVYLLKLSTLTNASIKIIIVSLLLALFSDYPCLFLYDFFHLYLNFGETGNIISDLIYCIFGIGLIEELCKLLPLIIIMLFFKKHLKQPMSYLLIGCASALSFSFTENILYFTGNNLGAINERALYCILIHLACTSIASYGIIIFIFHKASNKIFNGILYILLAIFIHGFYDFWLINASANRFNIISLFTLFFSVFILVKILNVCLNSSGAYQNKTKINIDKLNFILLILLSSFTCIEYIAYAYKHGAENSTAVFKDSIITAITLIPFLSFRLSRIDIANESFTYINIISRNKAFKLNTILNKTAKIESLSTSNSLFPINGVIKDRITIKGDTKWFLVEPVKPVFTSKGEVELFVIKSKNNSTKLTSKNHIIQVRIKYLDNEKISLKNIHFIGWGKLNIEE